MKSNVTSHQVKVDTKPLLDIDQVTFSDGTTENREKFKIGDNLEISLDYTAQEEIDNPIFTLAIIRADGVVCSYSRTDESGIEIGTIQGEGKVKINLGKLPLAPGIYMTKFSVWDKNMIHTYAVRNKDVLRVETDNRHSQTQAVFLPDINWEFSV